MPFNNHTIQGLPFHAPRGSSQDKFLRELAINLPAAVDGLSRLIERMRSANYDYDPYISVRDILPEITTIRDDLRIIDEDEDF